MEKALRSLRQLSAGIGTELAAFRAAALVPALGDAPEDKRTSEEQGSESESEAELEPADPREHSELYTWGRATNYQLGYGAGTEQQTPKLVQLPGTTLVTHLSCGRFHSTAVTACGRVFTWGVAGASGRLGLDLTKKTEAVVVEPVALPQFGPGRHHATKAVAGLSHTLALTSAGKLLVWGANDKGQLGCGQVGEAALQPVVMKVGPFQKLRVSDIAAGSAHSLCIAGEGHVYAWGCNGRGALGLGAPPSGPLQVAQPQSLPHLKAATCVEANSGGTVSVCLVASHGDAIMFGGAPVAATGADSRNVDNRFFTPGRVRRKDPELSDALGPDEWQLQRGTQLSPLRAVTVSESSCFGIDGDGLLWAWPTTSRPVTGDLAAISLAKAVPRRRPSELQEEVEAGDFVMVETDGLLEGPPRAPPSPVCEVEEDRPHEIEVAGVHAVGHATKAGTMWAVDDSGARHLWQLKRPSKPDGSWAAERFEYLAQVSCFTCGPENQAAVVNYTVPRFETSEDTSGVESQPKAVPSLQQLCEDKLCAKLSPRSFSLVCDIAWELNRPTLLDRAFRFLCSNAPLMFSRLHLPMLSQLPMEVLAALEVAARARQPQAQQEPEDSGAAAPVAEEAEVFVGLGEAFEDRLGDQEDEEALKQIQECCRRGHWSTAASQALSLLAISLPGTSAGEGPAAARLGLDFSAAEVESLKVEEKAEGESRKRRKASAGASPAVQQKASPTSSKTSPKSAAVSPFLQPERSSVSSPSMEAQDWVEVRTKPRKGSQELVASQVSPKAKAAESPKAKAAESPILGAKGGRKGDIGPKAKASSLASEEGSSARSLRLADFIKPRDAREKGKGGKGGKASQASPAPEATASGPSAMLVSAVSAVESKEKRASWGAQGAQNSVSLPEIIEEARQAKTKAAQRAKITTCSWGRDAIPSEQAPNQSIHQIQEEEEHIRQQEEIAEIEAMFAALEVAETQEALEREGGSTGNGEKPVAAKARGSKAPAAGQRLEGLPKARGGEGERKHRGRNARPGYKSDWWSQEWSSWDSGWWESSKQTHWQKRQVPEDRAAEAEGPQA